MQRCWNRKCNCRNFQRETIRKQDFFYLHRYTCPDCGTVWYEGMRDDHVQVKGAEEPNGKAEKEGATE